jgi:hypothetical protein
MKPLMGISIDDVGDDEIALVEKLIDQQASPSVDIDRARQRVCRSKHCRSP